MEDLIPIAGGLAALFAVIFAILLRDAIKELGKSAPPQVVEWLTGGAQLGIKTVGRKAYQLANESETNFDNESLDLAAELLKSVGWVDDAAIAYMKDESKPVLTAPIEEIEPSGDLVNFDAIGIDDNAINKNPTAQS